MFDVGLNQGPVTAIIANRGNIRLDPVNLLNMRLSRPTNITERVKLEPLIDFFNVTNASTVTQKISTNAPGIWLKPADLGGNPGILNPFIARFGLRLSF